MTQEERQALRAAALAAMESVASRHPRRGEPTFLRQDSADRAVFEVCGGCGKHVRDHYGGTEYRCYPRADDLDLGAWELQTSNSFRRIGTQRGDGDVLCAVMQRSDGHPDLHAHPEVLSYIVASQPAVVLALLDALDRCEDTLSLTRKHHEEDHMELVRLQTETRR